MEKINDEYKFSPNQFYVVNGIKKIIWVENLKLDKNNIILENIDEYELVKNNIENVLINLNIVDSKWDKILYDLSEIKFLWSNYFIIKLWNEYLKIICNISFLDLIKNKITKILN